MVLMYVFLMKVMSGKWHAAAAAAAKWNAI
jgi:hypothetical protein